MHTYRVDFTPESLRRDKSLRMRLMRDVRKVAAKLRKDGMARPRYLHKRRTDRTIGYWFQFEADVQKDKAAGALLKPYGWAASEPPVLPQSEWKPL